MTKSNKGVNYTRKINTYSGTNYFVSGDDSILRDNSGNKIKRSNIERRIGGFHFRRKTSFFNKTLITPFFKIRFVAARAEAGVSLRMNAVQVIDLVTGGGASAAAHGFGEEDGYDASDEQEAAENTENEDF